MMKYVLLYRNRNRFIVAFLWLIPFIATSQSPCTRAVPQPALRSDAYPHTQFHLQSDSLGATESTTLKNGDLLTIRHQGCENYVLSFRFETTRYRHNPSDLHFWFNAAAETMKTIEPGLDVPINISKGIHRLRQRARGSDRLTLGKSMDYGPSTVRNIVSVDSVEHMSGKKYRMIITFGTGPL